MKKIKLLLVSTLFTTFSYAQWSTKYFVDEFGDKTDEKYELMVADGTFSNSATTNSKAVYSFIKSKDNLLINVLEYGSNLANSVDSTFETVKIKQPSGNVITIKKVFFTNSGKLYFDKSLFLEVLSAIKEKGDYTLVFKRSSKYSESHYKIKFTIR